MWSKALFEQVREKCKRYPEAQSIYERFRKQPEQILAQRFDIPLLGGGWSHDYNCPTDGDRLILIDRHHHRCPTCNSVWSGSPWDEVATANEHWNYSKTCRNAAVLFGIDGEMRWAEWAKQVLLFYADHYDQYPLHDRFGGGSHTSGKVMCQTLSEASWLCLLAQGFHILKLHDVLTQKEIRHITHKLFLPALGVVANNPAGISNWQTYHNAAKALVAAALDEREMLQQVIDDPANGFYFQMENSLGEDGFWYEGAWGYHFYTLEAQTLIVLAAESFDLRLYEEPRFQSMYRAPLECMFPDGTLPPIHDSGEVRVEKYSHLFEFAAKFIGIGDEVIHSGGTRESLYSLLFGFEDEISPRVSDASTSSVTQDGFVHLKKAGMLFLKQKADSIEQSRLAMIDYGEHGGWHGHQDKLNLLYYAGGHPWLTDAGMLPYGNPIHFEYFKQTVAHNTVVVGGRSQEEAEGRIQFMRICEDGALEAVMDVSVAYPDVLLKRKIMMKQDVLLDVFHVRCENAQNVDWIIHTQGVPAADGQEVKGAPHWNDAPEDVLGTEDGYRYLSNPKAGKFNGHQWTMQWQWNMESADKDRLSLIALEATEEEELYLAESIAMPSIGKRSTLIRRRKNVKETVFLAVFVASRNAVEGVECKADYDAAAGEVTVRIGDSAPVILSARFDK
ncbi:heparinase II/III domain-containing protein [Paenibacillus sp. UNC451MF]|uniref:heparinase II/III domain-containing protein n=1 Tax=Paenibacillus sp. UNC451MF TaxID=1449063 RepID=UPI00048FCD70|nr:heparinase II/III family protein [Paenibacillus sp. UNC451MF]